MDLTPLLFTSVRICCLLVGQSKNIVYTDMIELSQSNKNLGRDHAFAAFVIGVGSLGNIDLLADFSLCEGRIFS